MAIIDKLKEAAKSRTTISFRYTRQGKDPGVRIGNPHAGFIRRLKSGEERIYVHMWQTEGVTDSGQPLPSWRQFFINELDEINLLNDRPSFELAEGYNPKSYEFPLFKAE